MFDGAAKTTRTNETMQLVIEYYLETKGAHLSKRRKCESVAGGGNVQRVKGSIRIHKFLE